MEELDAMKTILETLERISDDAARQRVLDWTVSKCYPAKQTATKLGRPRKAA